VNEWRYANQFGIHRRTAEVIKLAIEATQAQLLTERKKLRKLKYGS